MIEWLASPLVNNRNLNQDGSCVVVHVGSRCDTDTVQVHRAHTAAAESLSANVGLKKHMRV